LNVSTSCGTVTQPCTHPHAAEDATICEEPQQTSNLFLHSVVDLYRNCTAYVNSLRCKAVSRAAKAEVSACPTGYRTLHHVSDLAQLKNVYRPKGRLFIRPASIAVSFLRRCLARYTVLHTGWYNTSFSYIGLSIGLPSTEYRHDE